jgi:tRNA pseudouridine13 synthase
MLDGSRSRFAADAGDPDIQRRAAELDIHPTGPLAGAGDSGVTGEAARIEQSVLDDHAELVEGLVRFRLETDRRALRMRVLDLDWRFGDNDTLALSFSLRAGCYATTVLREVVEYVDASHDT